MYKKFEHFLLALLQSPAKKRNVLWLTLVAFIIAVMMIPTKLVLAKMLPGKNSDTYNLYVDLPNGSSIHQTQQVCECITHTLQQESEATDIEVFMGGGAPLDFAGLMKGSQFKKSENVAEIVVNLTKKHDRAEPSYLMVQRLRPIIQTKCESLYPRTSIKFTEPPAGPPTLAAVVAEVHGTNLDGIRQLSNRIKNVFLHTDGLVDVDVLQDEIYEKFTLQLNNEKISRAGLNVKQLNDTLYMAFEGMEIGVKNGTTTSDQIPIFLILSPQSQHFSNKDLLSVTMKLSELKMMNPMGMMVPLTELVEIRPIRSQPMIMTKNLRRMTNVVAETDMVSQVYPLMDARNTILHTFTDTYSIEKIGLFNLRLTDRHNGDTYELLWDGEMEVTLDTFVDLGGAFIAALVLIFLLMVVYYKSFTLSGIVLLGSFLSIIGVIIGHFIVDLLVPGTFFLTATSLIGFIALIGISSRNSLLLIDFTKQLMVEQKMKKDEAIAYAAATRAKPIFLTAAAIILASTLLAGDAVFGGLGVSLIFGTLAAVIASLLVVPVLMMKSDLEDYFNLKEGT